MKNKALLVSGVIFLLVSLMHLARVIFKVEVIVGGLIAPLWLSGIGFLVALILAIWMFSSS